MWDLEQFYASLLLAYAFGFIFGAVAAFFKRLFHGRGVVK